MEETIETLIKMAMGKMHTACPGTIVSYDAEKGAAIVQPNIRGASVGDDDAAGEPTTEALDHPTVPDVMILWPSVGGMMIVGPLNPGDSVWLIFGDRSIGDWLGAADPTQQVTPQDKRRFHLNDAVAIPAGRAFTKPLKLAKAAQDDSELIIGQDLEQGSDPMTLRLGGNGIRLGIDSSKDVLNVLSDLITQVAADVVTLGPLPPSAIIYAALQARISAINKP